MEPYYQRDGITIYHGDARDILPLLDTPVDLVLTDPPYGDVTHEGARAVTSTRALVDFASTTSAELRSLIAGLAPLCRAWYFATMEWQHIADLEREPPAGWRFVRFGVWVKPNGAPQFTGDRPGTGWEGVCILHRDTGRMAWNGGGHHAVWVHPKASGTHPTGKPEPLVRKWIAQFSNPGDLILDPFMGSGTTLRCALDMGRRAIGIELDERYCRIAAQRLRQLVLPLGAA
jgi:site-specific DNA-methyltransferase (adenine-specific)